MEKLTTFIGTLLQQHDIVVLPGFGGFVASYGKAYAEGDMVYPPFRSITFNSQLQYNDGLLIQHYASEYRTSIDAASLLARRDIDRLATALQNFGNARISSLGTMSLTDGVITFVQDMETNLLTSSFGLEPVCFPVLTDKAQPVATAQTTAKAEATDTEARIVTMTPEAKETSIFWKVAAVIAIVLFLRSFGTEQTTQTTQTASFIPLPPPAVVDEPIVSDSIEADAEYTYHIVVASFFTNARAKQFIEENSSRFDNLYIVNSEHRFRVCCRTFTEELDCETFLERFTVDNPRFADAWVLTDKQ